MESVLPGSSSPESPVKALLRQSADATKKLASAHLVLRTTGQIDALALISSGDLDVRTIPLAAKGSVTYNGQVNVPLYMANDTVSVKLFDEWTKIGTIEELIAPGLLDPSRGIVAIAEGVTDPVAHGTEQINDVTTTKVTGTLPPDAARIMLPDTDEAHNVTVWIREDGDHEIVQSLVDVGPGQSIQSTLSNWNGAVDVAAPVPNT